MCLMEVKSSPLLQLIGWVIIFLDPLSTAAGSALVKAGAPRNY